MARARVPIEPGQIFGSLTAVKPAGLDANQNSLWRCRCACGAITTVRGTELKRGIVRQCRDCGAVSGGRERRKYTEVMPDITPKHTAEYQSWSSMRWHAKETHVPVEPDWEDFAVFYADVGQRPDEEGNWVLGRIDSDLGYVRGNVEWQLFIERQRHKRTSLWWYVHGTRYPSANVAAEAFGVSIGTICNWCQGPRDRKTRKRGKPKDGCWAELQFPESE